MVGKKVHRLFTMMLLCFSISTATAVASSIWGDFEGYSKARVLVNDVEQQFSYSDVPGFIVKGTTVLPLRTLADSLQALVKWDNTNKTVNIYKPNVHMTVAREIRKDYSMKDPFGAVKHKDAVDFFVFAQVDNIQSNISSVRVSIISPDGGNAITPVVKARSDQKDSFWLVVPFNGVSFDQYGKYTVKFEMQLDEGSDFVVVSEKEIKSE